MTGSVAAGVSDHVAIVTGGASGIGRATAERLARDGVRIALVDVDAAGLTATVEALGGPEIALGVPTDVRSFEACARAIAVTVERFGRLDVLVNSAGVWVEGPTDTMLEADWDRVIDVNLKGTFQRCADTPSRPSRRRAAASSTCHRTRVCGATRALRSTARARAG